MTIPDTGGGTTGIAMPLLMAVGAVVSLVWPPVPAGWRNHLGRVPMHRAVPSRRTVRSPLRPVEILTGSRPWSAPHSSRAHPPCC
ncbi:hypothetical protein DZF91_14715 [Actinomadura logoneensis]|uniref:Uncharacterized protein n=1 Tax=Actinomadura logoneensis TaxID=2293572 RepID=A0A372JLH7_9ACTN|nr:hypothetical protein [Actinomadura logoneensis]RFU40882.1 hypothetical protein DZF91_14715 [Actinomadura logoneensis]